MVSTECPSCFVYAGFYSIFAGPFRSMDHRYEAKVFGEFRKAYYIPSQFAGDSRGVHDLKKCPQCDEVIHFIDEDPQYPIKKFSITKYNTDIPKSVREDMVEADTCIKLNLYKAASIMLRRTMENICFNKDHKIKGDLIDKINTVLLNYPDLRTIAHEIRIIGNEGTHIEARVYSEINALEVTTARKFIETLNNVLFITPADILKLSKNKKPTKKRTKKRVTK